MKCRNYYTCHLNEFLDCLWHCSEYYIIDTWDGEHPGDIIIQDTAAAQTRPLPLNTITHPLILPPVSKSQMGYYEFHVRTSLRFILGPGVTANYLG